jgi:uncharacterized protein
MGHHQSREANMDFNGTFIWNELMSSDVEATKAFYGKVAGWTYSEMASPDGSTYVVANVPGQPRGVAGIMAWPHDQPGANDWMPYLGVDDINASIAGIESAGGKVLRPVFEVPGTGHIAIVADATGSTIGLLQPSPMM